MVVRKSDSAATKVHDHSESSKVEEHFANKAEKAYKAALALERLQALKPSSMRQLFSATVAPVMDYGSPIWYLVASNKVPSMFKRAQRVAA